MKFLLTLVILIGWGNTMRLNTHIHTQTHLSGQQTPPTPPNAAPATNIAPKSQGLEEEGNVELLMTGVIKAFSGGEVDPSKI